ncbi:hypothetical protein WH47_11035 [Habropoda laboriosa]|uniref:Uncharacterized protein n=1 Tax=Habropoda laboriosa TaxID=597456 RepID=A0A0L7QLL5_9HYME|nr:hypothetical protein WH47_11035 [Habropoda laboriosa]
MRLKRHVTGLNGVTFYTLSILQIGIGIVLRRSSPTGSLERSYLTNGFKPLPL